MKSLLDNQLERTRGRGGAAGRSCARTQHAHAADQRTKQGFSARALARNERGQGTLEAAIVIPVMFVLLLLLLQPGIVLYDRLVMGNAAAEACRLMATSTDAQGSMQRSCEAFVRHRLAAVPKHDCFHVHDASCSWDIVLAGDEASQTVTVTIGNELKPLPLLDMGAKLLGLTNAAGNLQIQESVTASTQPGWAATSKLGLNPQAWIGGWCR